MRLDRYRLEPGVDSGQRDVVHPLVLDAGELVQHFLVEKHHHLGTRTCDRKLNLRRQCAHTTTNTHRRAHAHAHTRNLNFSFPPSLSFFFFLFFFIS